MTPQILPEPISPSPRPHFAESAVAFLLGAALMASMSLGALRGEGVSGNDSYYHLKMASMMPQAANLREFPWLRFCYFTERGDEFVSHHYGFHLLLVPLVQLSHRLTGDYSAGGAWATTLFFGLLVMALHRLVSHVAAPWRWLWLVLLVLLPFQFFTRHVFIRAITPSLLAMMWILLLALRRQFVPMAAVIAVYIHVYMGGVLFAPMIVAIYALSLVVCREPASIMVKLTCWSLAGWLMGVLTHPYRNGMWDFLRLQVLGSGLSPDIAVGREWRPYNDLWWFLSMCGPLLGAWVAAACLRLRMGARIRAEEMALLLLNIAFFVLTAKARRFIEYWPAFCMLSAVCLAAPVVDGVLTRWVAGWRGACAFLAIAGAIVVLTPQWRQTRADTRGEFDLPAIREAMAFLQEHSAPGDVVFTDDWDIFPVFFYFNSHNHYVVGLDPKFTHERRPDLWARYVKITRGQAPANETVQMPDGKTVAVQSRLEDIRDHFGAKWVVTDRDHQPLAAQLAAAGDFAELVYPSPSYDKARDKPLLVFRVR